jgi:phenylpropionate dioxygenase-like ring-hydroxylating dioxygenase large terminal subunit
LEATVFEGFANVWTPILRATRLGATPVTLELAGEQVVLFRDGRGGVCAMIDRCPHRGARLSLGKVTPEGGIECAFHGWCFDRQGACTHVPLNPTAPKRERLASIALPVTEVGGLVWVFTGTRAEAPPVVPDALVQPGWSRWFYAQDWSCHWTRAMENMLDMPHVPFVHRQTIGRAQRARLRPDSILRIHLEETGTGFRTRSELDGEHAGAALEWLRPNGMVLWLMPGSPPERGFRQHVFCVPINARSTRMFVVSTRTFLRHNPIGWLSDQFNRVIVREDRAIVESSQPAEVPPAGEEASVATDAPTLHFRRYYHRELAKSAAGLLPATRPPVPTAAA